MKIAFDIDGIIAHFDDLVLQRAIIFDKQCSRKKHGIVNRNKSIKNNMFDWSKKELNTFLNNYLDNAYPYFRPFNKTKFLLYHLKKLGHEIILVTQRGLDKLSKKKTTTDWLKENEICYDKLFFCVENKGELLKEQNVDIFIDDNYQNCIDAEQNGVFAIQKCEDNLRHDHYKNHANDFDELTEMIFEKINFVPELSKHPIIFDTDFSNEIDDEFALAFLLANENIKIAAITIAPHFSFSGNNVYIVENVQNSYENTKKMLEIARPELKNAIFHGDTEFMGYLKQGVSEAVKKIINVCKSNDCTTIISIGAPTNIAHAIKLCPEIASKIKLFALLGNLETDSISPEYNMSQDFLSTKFVLENVKNKTIFPANCYSNLLISKQFLKPHCKDNPTMQMLYDDFSNVMKTKFNGGDLKSVYDLIVPMYLTNPFMFNETEMGIKINNSHIIFDKRSKNKINLVSYCDPEYIINKFLLQMKHFEIKK